MSTSDVAAQHRPSFNGGLNRPSLPTGTIALANAGAPIATPSAAERAAYLAGRTNVSGGNAPTASGSKPGAVGLNTNGKRPPSVERLPSPSLPASSEERPSKLAKTAPVFSTSKANEVFDLRAEEEALRRANAGKFSYGNTRYAGNNSRAKKQDLIGEAALRDKLGRIATQHGMTMDEEAMKYIALAAETRLRGLLKSSINAQTHRVSSNYLRPPPLASSSSSSGQPKVPKAMWSTKVTNDENVLFELFARQNREDEQAIRMERMERLARESEQAKARERAERLANGMEVDGSTPMGPVAGPSTMNPGNGSGGDGPSPTPSAGPPTPITSTGFAQQQSSSALSPNPNPVFGQVKEGSKLGKKNTKKPAAKNRDLSAEVAHKLSNAMAMRSVGMQKSKYSWMTGGAPTVGPSPLGGGGKKKKDKGKIKEDETASAADSPDTTAGSGKAKEDTGATPKSSKPVVPVLSVPARRSITVQPDEKSEKRTVTDDKALTLLDLVFALEHEKGPSKGMGSSNDIVKRVYARPGGPWGRSV